MMKSCVCKEVSVKTVSQQVYATSISQEKKGGLIPASLQKGLCLAQVFLGKEFLGQAQSLGIPDNLEE